MYDANVFGKYVPSTMQVGFFTNAVFRSRSVCQPGLSMKGMSQAVLGQLPS